jgi:hypothetical protein
MKLTAYQRRHLEALTTFRTKKPSIWSVLMFRPRSWLPILFIIGLSFALYLLDPRWGMFMIGMSTGAILRIISHARFAMMAWPVTEEITDWTKVEALRREEKA